MDPAIPANLLYYNILRSNCKVSNLYNS